jgi:hypothetical protein
VPTPLPFEPVADLDPSPSAPALQPAAPAAALDLPDPLRSMPPVPPPVVPPARPLETSPETSRSFQPEPPPPQRSAPVAPIPDAAALPPASPPVANSVAAAASAAREAFAPPEAGAELPWWEGSWSVDPRPAGADGRESPPQQGSVQPDSRPWILEAPAPGTEAAHGEVAIQPRGQRADAPPAGPRAASRPQPPLAAAAPASGVALQQGRPASVPPARVLLAIAAAVLLLIVCLALLLLV